MSSFVRRQALCVVSMLLIAGVARGGDGRLFRRSRSTTVARSTGYTRTAGAFRPMTGTFYPTPYMMVGGNGYVGANGYTPMSQYGDGPLALYGPTSSLRAVAAPMTLVTTGYGGASTVETATGFSYPFLPAASPLVYPTRAQVRGSYDFQSTPPWWDTGQGWVDHQ